MAEIFGSVESSTTTENGTEIVYRIPALSSQTAKARARGNNRLKGLTNPQIENVVKGPSADLPGQNYYEVAVTAER